MKLDLIRPAILCLIFTIMCPVVSATVPLEVLPISGRHGMVVAGHPQAAQSGVETLRAGGNAIDAAIAVSLALGVAEPYGSGLGGKLMLLYYESASQRTYVLEAMDAAGSLDVTTYARRPEDDRSYGYGSVCVPGLPAGLWLAQQKWGRRTWAENVAPALKLAREGFLILPKTRDFFAEQEKKLRRGDAEIRRLYLPGDQLPVVGTRLANADLAHTLEIFATQGRDGFYRGTVAQAIVTAAQHGGGVLTLQDLTNYEPRLSEPIGIDFHGYHLLSAPPPSNGAPLFLAIMKAMESEPLAGAPLRSANTLDLVGMYWKVILPLVQRDIGDAPGAAESFAKLVSPESLRNIREQVHAASIVAPRAAWLDDSGSTESAMAATTHFLVADADGNIVCATQSQSLHFGAGVVPPGTGVVLNDSMSNFSFTEKQSPNYATPGKRPRSTISPTLVFQAGKPVLAIGLPGAARIPTAMLQVLLDRLALDRPLTEAIGDTRIHFHHDIRHPEEDAVEVEQSFPLEDAAELRRRGWKVNLAEPAGTGRVFGGINAIELNRGGYTGYADPRRTNQAIGY